MTVPAITIFLGAFLLFLVEPLTARRLLPWYGGSPMVWIVALLFFQGALLAGYLYAHGIASRGGRGGRLAHIALLFVALAFLPVGPTQPPVDPSSDPTFAILRTLVTSLGLPFLLLASTSPLVQSLATSSTPASGDGRGERIYRLFALSNLGALTGLWCYPFVLEPFASLETQRWVWSAGFALFVVVSILLVIRAPAPLAPRPRRAVTLSGCRSSLPWWALAVALALTGSTLFLATSNQLTRKVASVPFLWVLPLSLYLLSFVVAFERERWYVRWVWGVLFLGSLFGILSMLTSGTEPKLGLQLALYSVNLFAGTLLCHGEIYRMRPPPEELTFFYLLIAFGGALGGAFVALAAPSLFASYGEYPLSLGLVYLVVGVSVVFGSEQEGVGGFVAWFVSGLALAVALGSYGPSTGGGPIASRRNFFGVLRVFDRDLGGGLTERDLWNGPVAHGAQLFDPAPRLEPILYYGPGTGVGIAFSYLHEREPPNGAGRSIGVVGLGTGSLAAYGRASERIRFYELNPQVVDVARSYFTYLADSRAEISIAVGDARLSLARELRESGPQRFDLLVLDAFAGDAIPVHLLTREAFALYQAHLAPEGILAVHVSNLHFDLRPVVRAHAEALGAIALPVESDADPGRHLYFTSWVLVTKNADFIASRDLQRHLSPWRAGVDPDLSDFDWTDDYSSVFRVLK